MFSYISQKIQELFCCHAWEEYDMKIKVYRKDYEIPVRTEDTYRCSKCKAYKTKKY